MNYSRLQRCALVLSAQMIPLLAYTQTPDTTVRMAGAPRRAGTATLVEELSIGAANGADEYTFGRVHDLAVGKDGSIYVLDLSLRSIRKYDATGKHIVTFAREGQGPGEIQVPSGMAVMADGSLALHDSRNRRINIYSASGANLTQLRLPDGGTLIAHRRGFAIDTAGYMYVKRGEITLVPVGQRAPGRDPYSSRDMWLKLRARDGVVVDTLPEPVWPAYPQPFRAEAGRGWRQMAMPFVPRRLMTISPLGFAVTALPSRYAFELHMQPGRVVSVRRDVRAPAVDGDEYSKVRENIETKMREVNPRWSWSGRDIPRVKPLFVDVEVGLDGRIWITRDVMIPPLAAPSAGAVASGGASAAAFASDDIAPRPAVYDVFEPDGTLIGTVQAPLLVTLVVMRGDHVWGIARDANDVEYVKRYRIAWR